MLFDRCQQRVLPWGHIGATWRMQLNLCILRPTGVHNWNSKWIGSAIFAQLTAQSAVSCAPIHQKCPFPRAIRTCHVTHDALGPCEPTTETAPQSVQPCLHRWPQSVPIWFACYTLKIVTFHVGIWTSCNTWFIGPTRVRNTNGNLIVSAVFAGLTSVTNWQITLTHSTCLYKITVNYNTNPNTTNLNPNSKPQPYWP